MNVDRFGQRRGTQVAFRHAMNTFRHLSPRVAILLCSALAAPSAFAELTNDPLLGPGVRTRPAYDGSDSQRFEAVPVIRYFGDYAFARTTQGALEGGARLGLAPALDAGAQLV